MLNAQQVLWDLFDRRQVLEDALDAWDLPDAFWQQQAEVIRTYRACEPQGDGTDPIGAVLWEQHNLRYKQAMDTFKAPYYERLEALKAELKGVKAQIAAARNRE